MPGWTFTFTDMIQAFPTLEPRDSSIVADLHISGASEDAGHSGSFSIKWYRHDEPTPQLEAFCDSWEALQESGLISILVQHDTNKNPRQFGRSLRAPVGIDEIKASLLALGFTDDTLKYSTHAPDRCTCCNGSGWIYKTKETSR